MFFGAIEILCIFLEKRRSSCKPFISGEGHFGDHCREVRGEPEGGSVYRADSPDCRAPHHEAGRRVEAKGRSSKEEGGKFGEGWSCSPNEPLRGTSWRPVSFGYTWGGDIQVDRPPINFVVMGC